MFYLFLMLLITAVYGEEGRRGEDASHSKEGGAAQEEKGPYIGIGPMTISVVKQDEIKGYIRLKVNLFAEKKEDFEHVKAIAPRIQSDFIIQLSSILSQFWITGASEPRLDNIKNILQLITNKILGHDKVKAILIDSYFFAKPPDDGAKPFG